MLPLPDEKTMCHRTGFTKSCRSCVTDHGCRLWKYITLEVDPATSPGHAVKPVAHWDCVDSINMVLLHDMLRRQLQTTATVDKLAKTVADANDVQMVGALSHINNRLEAQAREQAALGHSNGIAGLIEGGTPE